MNLPFEITLLWERLASPAGYRLSLSLIHFLWQGVVIAILAALFIRLLGRGSPHRRYALGLAGLLAMAVAPVATFFLITPPTPPPETTFSTTTIPATAALDAGEIPPDDLTNEIHRLDALIQHLESELDEPTTLSAQIPPEPRSWFDLLREWQPYLLLLWLAGTSVCALRLAIGAQASWRYRLGRKPIPEAARETLFNLAQRLGVKPPRVFVSERVLEAIVVGLFRPMILLPAAWIGRIPPELLEAVLAHEIAHLRRHDLWINLAQRLLETLLFYHPALWWLSRRVRLEREFCCDEIAVQALDCRAAYARALEFVAAERLLASRLATLDTALVAGMGGDEMALLNRVRRVLGRDPLPGRFRWRWATGGALLLPFCLWGVFLWADTFWANSFAWAGGEEKPPVVAEQPAEASELAAEATPEDDKPDFERATGTSLLDEGVVVAVICRTPAALAWDNTGWNYAIMKSISNRLHQHGVTVRRPEQVFAWSVEHPEWDEPADVGQGVEATHAVLIDVSSLTLSAKQDHGNDRGRAKTVVHVVAEQPDGDWNHIFEMGIHSDYSVAAKMPPSEQTSNVFARQFQNHLSRQVGRLFYKAVGKDSIDIEANPFGLAELAPPDGDPSSEDPFADAGEEVPFGDVADGFDSPAPDKGDRRDSPFASGDATPPSDGLVPAPFGMPAEAEEPEGAAANRELEDLKARNEMLLEKFRQLSSDKQELIEQIESLKNAGSDEFHGTTPTTSEADFYSMLDEAGPRAVATMLLEKQAQLDAVGESQGRNHPDYGRLRVHVMVLQQRLDAFSREHRELQEKLARGKVELEDHIDHLGAQHPEVKQLEHHISDWRERLSELQDIDDLIERMSQLGEILAKERDEESVDSGREETQHRAAEIDKLRKRNDALGQELERRAGREEEKAERSASNVPAPAEPVERFERPGETANSSDPTLEDFAPFESPIKITVTGTDGEALATFHLRNEESGKVRNFTTPLELMHEFIERIKKLDPSARFSFQDRTAHNLPAAEAGKPEDDDSDTMRMAPPQLVPDQKSKTEAEDKSKEDGYTELAETATKEGNSDLAQLRQDYETALAKQLDALKKQREKVNALIERGAASPDNVIEVDKQIVEVMGKLLELKKERTVSREPVLRPKVSPVERLWAPVDPIEAQGPEPDAAIEPQAPPIPDNENWRSLGPPAGPTRATPRGPLMAPGEFKVTMSRDGNVAIVVFHDAAFGAEITYSVPVENLPALLEKLSKQTKSKPVPLPDGEIRWGDPKITLPMKGPEPVVPNYGDPSSDDGFSEPPSEENSDDRPLGSPPGEGFQRVPSKSNPNEKKETSSPPATFE